MPGFSIDGLVTGLDTTKIIEQLVAADRAPAVRMAARKATYEARAGAWDEIAAKVSALRTAAGDLLTTSRLSVFSAASSAPGVLSATAGPTAAPGSIALRVQNLATAHQVASAGVASATATVGPGTATLATGLSRLGVTAAASAGLAAGAHTVEVTQASAGASTSGSAVAAPVTIGAGNQTLELTVNGAARTVTIAAGTYATAGDLATAVQAAAGADVSVGAEGGVLTLSTIRQGSAASLQVTGGSALASLGLAAMAAAAAGTDAVVSLDGTATTLSNFDPGAQATLTGAGGNLTVTLGAGLSAGSGKVHVVEAAAGTTLAGLASQIGAAGAGVSARVVDTGAASGPARLVVSAGATGEAAAFTLDLAGFTGVAGTATTIAEGHDATLSMGSLTITRASNTVSDLLPGVTLNLASASPGSDVTVSVTRDVAAITAKVDALVKGINGLLEKLDKLSAYTPEAGAAALTGDGRARALVASLYRAVGGGGGGPLGGLSSLGVSLGREGTYTFDPSKLAAALESDFEGTVARLARTGTAADSRVSFLAATRDTVAGGPYDVVVTAAAEQATLSGTPFANLGAPETITVTMGGVTAAYTGVPPATPDLVAAGLNQAIADAGLGLEAKVVGGAVVLTTTAYGSRATFTVTSTGGSGLNGTATGVDVTGTIGGVAATGSGQTLTAGSGDPSGLAVKVTATAAEVAAGGGSLNLGGVTYSQGAAGGLARLLDLASGPGGLVTAAQDGAEAAAESLGERIADFEARVELRRLRYVRQFAQLESVIGQLSNQGSWLASQIAALPQPGGGNA